MKYSMVFLLSYIILFLPSFALANGASYHFGIKGSEVTVNNLTDKYDFDVDEMVIIDAGNKNVTVEYKINNNETSQVKLNMVFPVQRIGGDCEYQKAVFADNRKSSVLETLKFKVSHNKNDVPAAETDQSNIVFSKDYEEIKNESCLFAKFDINLEPGDNIIKISHAIFDSGGDSSGQKLGYYYIYSIWPAKNWVTKFNNAIWRIYPPKYVEGIAPLNLNDKWVVIYDYPEKYWYQYKININAPGKISRHEDYVEFTAEDYQPSGSIVVSVDIVEIRSLLDGCTENNIKDCWRGSLEKTLSLRPYEGNKKKYIDQDLALVLIEDNMVGRWKFIPETLPYLRNEIYARKGYIFKSDDLRKFFEKMPWYKPASEHVDLDVIEKDNVDYIKSFENINRTKLIDSYFQ